MKALRKVFSCLNKIQDVLEEISSAICVFCLSLQILTITVLVIGRYFFKKVPQGTEELCLLCMVWIALLSITLCIRDDSHMKMDILDMFVSERAVDYIRVFDGIILVVFSVLMVKYGFVLWKLKWGSTLTGLPMSGAWFYAVLPISGILCGFSSLVFLLNTIAKLSGTDNGGDNA